MSQRDLRKKFIPVGSPMRTEGTGNVLPPIMISSSKGSSVPRNWTTGRPNQSSTQQSSRKLNRTQRVIEAAKNLPDVMTNPNKQKEYMDTLAHYCVLEKSPSKKLRYRTAALENGFGQACSLILGVHIHNKVTVRRCLRCLQMGGTPLQIYKHIMKHKVHERAFEALLKYYDDVIVTEVALSSFTSLAECPGFVQYLYTAKFKGDDFVSLLCRVLIRYKDDRLVQIYGCSLITSLLASADRALRKKLIFHFELLDLAIRAMRRFQGSEDPTDKFHDAEVQSKAIYALLYGHEHFYFQMVQGVGEITSTALKEHYSNSKLVTKFSMVLGRLSESKETAICFYHNGILDNLKRSCLCAIVKLERIHEISDENSLRGGAELLENIMNITRLIAKLLGIDDIYTSYIKSSSFEQDLDFFGKLIGCQYLRAFNISDNDIHTIKAHLRKPFQHLVSKTVKIGEWVAYLLSTILMKSPEVVGKMVRKYFWKVVLEIAEFYKNNIGIQIKVIKALAELSKRTFPPPPPLKEENAQEEAELNPKRFENNFFTAKNLEIVLLNVQSHFEKGKSKNAAISAQVKMQLVDLMEKAKELEF